MVRAMVMVIVTVTVTVFVTVMVTAYIKNVPKKVKNFPTKKFPKKRKIVP